MPRKLNAADEERLARLRAWADDVDTDDLEPEDVTDLAAVGAAGAQVEAALRALDAAVAEARNHNRSWPEIGQRLGITRQAAVKRWGKREAKPTQTIVTNIKDKRKPDLMVIADSAGRRRNVAAAKVAPPNIRAPRQSDFAPAAKAAPAARSRQRTK